MEELLAFPITVSLNCHRILSKIGLPSGSLSKMVHTLNENICHMMRPNKAFPTNSETDLYVIPKYSNEDLRSVIFPNRAPKIAAIAVSPNVMVV